MDRAALQDRVECKPDAILDKLAPEMGTGRTAVGHSLKLLKISRKKTWLYQERDEEQRREFKQLLDTLDPDLNQIEEQWAILKARIRKHKPPQQPLEAALTNIFKLYG